MKKLWIKLKAMGNRKPNTITKILVTLLVMVVSYWVLGLLINWLGFALFFKLVVWLYIGRLWLKVR